MRNMEQVRHFIRIAYYFYHNNITELNIQAVYIKLISIPHVISKKQSQVSAFYGN